MTQADLKRHMRLLRQEEAHQLDMIRDNREGSREWSHAMSAVLAVRYSIDRTVSLAEVLDMGPLEEPAHA